MRKIFIVPLVALSLAGCANGPGQGLGTLGGAGAGALLGSMIGGGTGRLVAIGAGTLLGAVAGGAVGQSIDNQNHQYIPPNQRGYSYGEDAAYNRGRADYEEEQQRLREQRAYYAGRNGR